MQTHDTQPSSVQPKTGTPKAHPLAPRPFEVTNPGQDRAASSTNPFPRRPHEVYMGETVSRSPVVSPEAKTEPDSPQAEQRGYLPFSLQAPGQPPPPLPWWHRTQAKLTIGQPNDPFEQEADAVAEQVMTMPEPVQRQAAVEGEAEEAETDLQPKLLGDTSTSAVQRQPEGAKTETGTRRQPFHLQAPDRPSPPALPWWGTQAKLTIGQPNDAYEQEADQVAERVMSMAPPAIPNMQRQVEEEAEDIQTKPLAETITPLVQRQEIPEEESIQTRCETCEQEEPIQRAAAAIPQPQPDLENRLNASQGGGSPLPDDVRSFMEPRFGADFSQVRVHTGGEAVQMNKDLSAQAFTHKQDIYFGAGKSPGRNDLTAHELTHVVQQTGGLRLNKVARRQALTAGQTEIEPHLSSKALPNLNSVKAGNQPLQRQVHFKQERAGDLEAPLLQTKQFSDQTLNPQSNSTQHQSSEFTQSWETPEAEALPAKTLLESDRSVNLEPLPLSELKMGAIETGEAETESLQPKTLPDLAFPLQEPAATQASTSDPLLQTQTETTDSISSPPDLISLTVKPGSFGAPTNLIQRDGEDDSGLLGGIRRTINRIVDGLRSGWNSLSSMAQDAFEGLRGQFSSITQGLGSLLTSALSGIQNGWTALSQTATQLTNGIQQQLQGAIGTITGAVSAIGQAVVTMDAAALQAAFGRVTGLIGTVFGQLQQAGQAVFAQITGLWNGLQGQFNEVLNNLANRASQIFNQLQAAAQAVRQRLTTAWDALQNRASQLSGVLGGVLERARSLVSSLLSWAEDIWNGIQRQWTALRGRLDGFLQGVRQQITNALQGLRQRAMAIWERIRGFWQRTQAWVKQQIQRLVSGVRSIWSRIQNFPIGNLVNKIAKFVPFIRAVQQAVADPDSAMQPMVDAIAGKLSAEMPAKSIELGQQHIQQKGGARPETTSQSTEGMIQRTPLVAGGNLPGNLIQRNPGERTTTSLSAIWSGFVKNLSAKWQSLDIWKMVKDMLWNLVWPWPAVGRELSELWNHDLKGAAASLFAIRTDSFLNALHDLWTNFLHLLDIPLAIWRRINNIGMHLMGWITAALVIIGAIGGSVAGGVIGGILSAAVSLGIATPAGAAGGAGAGGLAGAGAGLAASLAIGEVLLVSFAAAEANTIAKTLAELWTGRQTDDEKEADYSQLADSLIALGVTAVLMLIGWIASKLAAAIVAFVKRIRASRVPPTETPSPSTQPPGTETPRPETPRPGLAASVLTYIRAALARIRQKILDFFFRLRHEGKVRLRSSGVNRLIYEGAARELHPQRFGEILAELEREGINVEVRTEGDPWTGSYSPGLRRGEPGSMNVHRNVDLRTLEHEFKHFLDDRAAGYPGLKHYIENPQIMAEMERAAYDLEIQMVREHPTLSEVEKIEIIRQLEAAKQAELDHHLGPQ